MATSDSVDTSVRDSMWTKPSSNRVRHRIIFTPYALKRVHMGVSLELRSNCASECLGVAKVGGGVFETSEPNESDCW